MFEKKRDWIGQQYCGDVKELFIHYLNRIENSQKMPQSPFSYCYYSCCSDGDKVKTHQDFHLLHEMSLLSLSLSSICPTSSLHQVFNLLSLQDASGFLPAWISKNSCCQHKKAQITFPPIWLFSLRQMQDRGQLSQCNQEVLLSHLKRHITWYEHHRCTQQGGFYFLDVMDGVHESRFPVELRDLEEEFCLDASSYQYLSYRLASIFSSHLQETKQLAAKANALKSLIQTRLSGHLKKGSISYISLHPLIVGALSADEVETLIFQVLQNQVTKPKKSALNSYTDLLYTYLICYAMDTVYGMKKIARKLLRSSFDSLIDQHQDIRSCDFEAQFEEKKNALVPDLYHTPLLNILEFLSD